MPIEVTFHRGSSPAIETEKFDTIEEVRAWFLKNATSDLGYVTVSTDGRHLAEDERDEVVGTSTLRKFSLSGSATLHFHYDMDDFKRPETLYFEDVRDAVKHAMEELTTDQRWGCSIVDESGTRVGPGTIEQVYRSLAGLDDE